MCIRDRFSSFWGLLLSGGFIVLLLLPASFVLFRYGVWLDFAIPLLAVQLYQMVVEFREAREQRCNDQSAPCLLYTSRCV